MLGVGQNKKEYQKYATQISPGTVVYELDFETGYVNIASVVIYCEKEVLHNLKIIILRTKLCRKRRHRIDN